jgi:hypothetical protein
MMGEKHPGDACEVGGRESLTSSLKTGVIIQVFLFILTALMLDGGQLFRQFLLAMVGYWIGVAFIFVRRESTPKKTDHFFLRYGSLVLLLLAPMVANVIYAIVGESTLNGLERWF